MLFSFLVLPSYSYCCRFLKSSLSAYTQTQNAPTPFTCDFKLSAVCNACEWIPLPFACYNLFTYIHNRFIEFIFLFDLPTLRYTFYPKLIILAHSKMNFSVSAVFFWKLYALYGVKLEVAFGVSLES